MDGGRKIHLKFFHRYVIRDSIARDSTLRRKGIAVTVPAYAPMGLQHSFLTTRLGVAKKTRKFALYWVSKKRSRLLWNIILKNLKNFIFNIKVNTKVQLRSAFCINYAEK